MKKKILSFCLSSLLLLGGTFAVPASASTQNNNTTKFKLDDVYISVPYNPNKIDITYKNTDKEVEAVITDKATHKRITSIGEVKDSNKSLLKSSGNYLKTVYSTVEAGPTESRLYAVLNCYHYDNFRQINSINKTYWSEASSGDWKLERESSDGYIADPTSAGVGTKATITGTANVVVTTTSSTEGSFSIEALEGVGFSVKNVEGSTYYARCPIQCEYTASLYS